MPKKTLRLILGDQLNANHSWFKNKDSTTLYLIAEIKQESTYVKHHTQKICAFFSAMEHFSQALKSAGHNVLYLTLNDTEQYKTLSHMIQELCDAHEITHFEYQRPDEYRLLNQLQYLKLENTPTQEFDTEHFLLPFNEIDQYFEKGKHHTMESFYRKMRKRFNILMDDGKPRGEQWNFDAKNRNKLKTSDISGIPQPLVFTTNVQHILNRLKDHNIPTFGSPTSDLLWPVSRAQSLSLLKYFCDYGLPNFGKFQDAMTEKSEHKWSLYHSRLSFSINAKMLHPSQVIQAAINAFDKNSKIDIAQVEGFVRQILGWREYIRGMYWVNMPEYASLNALNASRKLPDYFWNANTKMSCLHHSIQQSLEYSYAHHIQRLMVTGNFCLLTGISPDEVDEWYLGIYIDAIEWVELPNTRGMTQYADGGIIATKPYCASGNYINKMSDYCKNCFYSVKEKTGEKACPLNSLYWTFMDKHRDTLEKNPRIGMTYRTWDKMDAINKDAILKHGQKCLDNIEEL